VPYISSYCDKTEVNRNPENDMDELIKKLNNLPLNFYGVIEVGFQNGIPGVLKVTETHKLNTNSSRSTRGTDDRTY
jgi:hypothetical protein